MNRILFSSQSTEWATPAALYHELNKEFAFNFDPCPIGGNRDGLAQLLTPWQGKRVFCNPPYGPGLEKWIHRGPEAEVAVFLVPARTDTKWFHELVLPKATEIRFIKGRLKFGESQNCAPFPSMLVIYDTRNQPKRELGKLSAMLADGHSDQTGIQMAMSDWIAEDAIEELERT